MTHRGNRRQQVFFSDDDRRFYIEMLRQCAERFGVQIWAYCLMGNHVHLIAVPEREEVLAHQRYAAAVNARRGWTGSLWAGRFFSTALDEDHLWKAVRYVELNPVRARLAREATGWEWSSAGCHAGLRTDALLSAGRPFPGQMEIGRRSWSSGFRSGNWTGSGATRPRQADRFGDIHKTPGNRDGTGVATIETRPDAGGRKDY